MNYEQFLRSLQKARLDYTLFRCEAITFVEVGRFGYRFNETGNPVGGWISNCEGDWQSEWEKWLALLQLPIS